ncbi:hypothetical protein ScalyP_jg10342 [Parmales sp. scaly parma]|nr:hypothetical protein ScalyP_jg10342 [Parmales sp. scaly parma]
MPGLGPKKKKPRSEQQQYKFTEHEKITTLATTQLRRELKQIKTKELLQAKKKLKTSEATSKQTNIDLINKHIDFVNSVDLTIIVNVCLRRIGLSHIGPNNDPLSQYEEGHPSEEQVYPKRFRNFVEKTLNNKKICEVLDGLNVRVNDMRRKVLVQSENIDGGVQKSIGKRKRPKNSAAPPPPPTNNWSKKHKRENYNSTSGVFLQMNAGSDASLLPLNPDEDNNNDSGEQPNPSGNIYGPGGDDDEWNMTTQMTTKNRKGQRARRAKAQALEAKKQGLQWDSSLNWREKKKKKVDGDDGDDGDGGDGDGNNNNNNDKTKNKQQQRQAKAKEKVIKKSDVAESGKNWKDNKSSEHPSWLAKQAASKSNIVAFSGKKTTFD